VSNRQKVSGVTYPTAETRLPLALAVDLSVAASNDTAGEYVTDLERQRSEHVAAVAPGM